MNWKFALAATMTATLLTSGASAAAVTFSDSDFADANWTAVEALDTSPDNSFSFSGARVPFLGNPGANSQALNQLVSTTPSSIGSGHFQTGAVFDPGEDGTFGTLEMSFDGISLGAETGAMGYAVLIEQGGNYFQLGLGQVLDNAGLARFGAAGLVKSDFIALDGGVLDLSNAGSALSIGIHVSNGTFGAPGDPSVNKGGFDNWSAAVHAVEIHAPGATALFMLALTGLGFARRREGRSNAA